MIYGLRWYGEDDAVRLSNIRQINGITSVVTALYDELPGAVWSLERIQELKHEVESYSLEISVIESVPVHEEIKLGGAQRDKYIEAFCTTLENLAKAEVYTVCYNFMPLVDWTRSTLQYPLADGSTALAYEASMISQMHPLNKELALPGWAAGYTQEEFTKFYNRYQIITEENLWDNLSYFLERVVPFAEANNIRLAIHPDDPPWSVFGLPRIIQDSDSLDRLVKIYDSPANGLCICTGSLGASELNDVPAIIHRFGARNRINFVHARNIKRYDERSFYESGHQTAYGSVDMFEVIQALSDVGFSGPIRPDHGRTIWGEEGRPGYGLYDRALGVAYLIGLEEAVTKLKIT